MCSHHVCFFDDDLHDGYCLVHRVGGTTRWKYVAGAGRPVDCSQNVGDSGLLTLSGFPDKPRPQLCHSPFFFITHGVRSNVSHYSLTIIERSPPASPGNSSVCLKRTL